MVCMMSKRKFPSLAQFGRQFCGNLARRFSERTRALLASFRFRPGTFAEQQFLRFVHYRQLAAWIPQWVGERRQLRVIEFGGSNGVIKAMFQDAEYEVAPNFRRWMCRI